MKITKTFENATLRTVNNGYIELDYNGKTHCFNNASVVSVNNGSISVEVDWKLERGELIKAVGSNIDCYVIFNYKSTDILYTYGSINMDFAPIGYFKFDGDPWACDYTMQLFPVTPEEQQAFDDFCKSKGKIWNKEKLQWEKYRWKPSYNDRYYFIELFPLDASIKTHRWTNDEIDNGYYKKNNCFKTKEEAEAKLEQIKQILNQ